MPQHDFAQLYAQYPAIIDGMPNSFTSHQFILQLARQHQALYVEALYSYRSYTHLDKPTPFLAVHRLLSRQLSLYSNLIRQLEEVDSVDIWGRSNRCAAWKKV